MKVLISYPPLKTEKGYPTLGQNRQFQYFKEPTYIYPVVPAQAATLLEQNGFETIWNDCIAEGLNYSQYLNFINQEKPDLIAFEAKTPVIKQYWQIINDIKTKVSGFEPVVVLFGDHVTALPQESFDNCPVDFILTGGDYDFLLLNLCNVLRESKLATVSDELKGRLEPGIYYRENGQIKNTGPFKLNHDLNRIPFINRELTKWRLYAYKNGNYRRTPGTYIMSGRDCWWGKCSFCSWTTLYPQFRVRSVNNVLDEIEYLVNTYNIKEIMDDTGTFPVGDWLLDFCRGMIKRGLNKKINLDCNMRFSAVGLSGYKLMKKAGFRFLLFGLESSNQNTLDKINKNLKADSIVKSCRDARRAGLYPHITIMFGYPWEDYEDAKRTLDLGRWLLKKGYAYTMQATIVIPYPNTPLFQQCLEQDLLYTLDWDKYDMKQPVMKLKCHPDDLHKLVQGMYSVSFNPEFILRKILSIRDMDDVKYFWRAFLKVIGHIADFRIRS